jgi:hypothetical protein
MKKIFLLVFVCFSFIAEAKKNKNKFVVIETNKGCIKIEVFNQTES